ncbi:MAG TPA: penicillin-binding protein 1C [Vicinamibacterales bacterium]|nr:penicillin-binding protein 1C [Vicinamibacterales bacterium]
MTFGHRRIILGVAAAFVVPAAVMAWVRLGPLPAGLLDPPHGVSTLVYDRHGEVLYEARAGDGSRSVALDAASLAPSIVDATIAAEDRRFWSHLGVDPLALVRAAARDIRYRRLLEGGSTITQQTAKLLLARADTVRLKPDTTGNGATGNGAAAGGRGLVGKLYEAIIAMRLEHRFSKREILALYLNLAPYGNQLIGAERASRAYFGRGVETLTPAQAAFLAALPQRPSSFNPYRDPTRARRRQEAVIARMGRIGLLPPDREREALDERLTLVREPARFIAPHFVERVIAQAGTPRGAAVTTTLDADLQRTVQGIIRAERPALNRIGAHNVAVAVLDNRSGDWLAWEGSGDYTDTRHGGTIDGVTTPRQPGSALKPFTYAAAFESGDSPATVLPDVPSFFPTAQDGVLYAPRNYDDRFRGPLLARRALAGSENVPAVALASQVGVPAILRLLRAAGLTTFDKTAAYYGLGLTLGDAEVRLDELVAAYAVFARGGVTLRTRMIRADDGDAPGAEHTLVSPRTAFWITDILADDEARSFAFGRGGSLEFAFPVAAKTGTSQAYHDNWAIGYTRSVTVGVWVGNFDRRPLTGSSGVAGAGPIFHAVMLAAQSRAVGDLASFSEAATVAMPERTTKETVCALSGMRASPWCPSQKDEWIAADRRGDRECTWHLLARTSDPEPGTREPEPRTREPEREPRTPNSEPRTPVVVVQWPSEYLAWARTERLLDQRIPLPSAARTALAVAPRAMASPTPAPLRIVNPPDGAVYLIDPTLRREFQALPLRAATDAADVEWRIDGRSVGRGAPNAAVAWPLSPGAHTVTVRDVRGREANAVIVVK